MTRKFDSTQSKKKGNGREVKVSKTFRLDSDILTWLEKQGEKEGLGYQTYLNWFLRKSMLSESSVEERLRKLEEIVFNKKDE